MKDQKQIKSISSMLEFLYGIRENNNTFWESMAYEGGASYQMLDEFFEEVQHMDRIATRDLKDQSVINSVGRTSYLRVTIEIVNASYRSVRVPYDWQLDRLLNGILDKIDSVYDENTVKMLDEKRRKNIEREKNT